MKYLTRLWQLNYAVDMFLSISSSELDRRFVRRAPENHGLWGARVGGRRRGLLANWGPTIVL